MGRVHKARYESTCAIGAGEGDPRRGHADEIRGRSGLRLQSQAARQSYSLPLPMQRATVPRYPACAESARVA